MFLSRRSSTDSLLLLVARLQMQDVQTLKDARKGQGRQNSPPADGFAIALQEALFAADIQVVRDHRLAQNLERAGDLYGEAQDAVGEETMRAMHHHERLSRVGSQSSSARNSGINTGAQSPAHPGFEHGSGKFPVSLTIMIYGT